MQFNLIYFKKNQLRQVLDKALLKAMQETAVDLAHFGSKVCAHKNAPFARPVVAIQQKFTGYKLGHTFWLKAP